MSRLAASLFVAIVFATTSGCSDADTQRSGEDAGAKPSSRNKPDASEQLDSGAIHDAAADSDAARHAAADASDKPSTTEITMTDITVGELVFHARVAGPESGEVIILLHGFPESSYEWHVPMQALAAEGYRVVAPDQRGYSPGARPSSVDDYSVQLLASDITGIADAIGASRFHLVGHDWGASIAWLVADLAPERVISLTTVSVPHPDAFAQELADQSSCQYAASSYFDFFTTAAATDYLVDNDFAGLRSLYEGVATEDVEAYIEEIGDRETLDAALNWYRANIANRMIIAPPIGQITVPTLFIWSDEDTALCGEGGELSRAFIDAPYRFETIAGENHWVVDNAPDRVSRLLLEQIHAYALGH